MSSHNGPLTKPSPKRGEGDRRAVSQRLFTEEHGMLRKSVRAFVEKEVTPHVQAWEEAGRIPKTFWRRLGELGFLGLEFPVEYGGGGWRGGGSESVSLLTKTSILSADSAWMM